MRVLCFSESSSLSAESMVLLLNDWAHVSRKFTQGEYAKCLHNRKENDSKIKVRAPSERCAAHPVAAQLAVKIGWVRAEVGIRFEGEGGDVRVPRARRASRRA